MQFATDARSTLTLLEACNEAGLPHSFVQVSASNHDDNLVGITLRWETEHFPQGQLMLNLFADGTWSASITVPEPPRD